MKSYILLTSAIFLWIIIFTCIFGTFSCVEKYETDSAFEYTEGYFEKDRELLAAGALYIQELLDYSGQNVNVMSQNDYLEMLEKSFYPMIQDISDDEYQVIRELGDGTYAVVYEAIHVPTQTTVAIKVFKDTYNRAHIPFHKELWTYFYLLTSDPYNCDAYIAPILTIIMPQSFEALELECTTFMPIIVYEKMEISLLEYTQKWITKEASHTRNYRISYLALAILQAIRFLHENYIIHTDIKPENMMLNVHPYYPGLVIRFVLIDLGCIHRVHPVSGIPMDYNHEELSTPSHKAPELFLLDSSVYVPVYLGGYQLPPFSYSVDIWAAGMTIAEMFDRTYSIVKIDEKLMNSQLAKDLIQTAESMGIDSDDYLFNTLTIADRFIKVNGWHEWVPKPSWPSSLMIPKQKKIYHQFIKAEKVLNSTIGKDLHGTLISQVVLGNCAPAWPLISSMLNYDPNLRITADNALNDPWLSIECY